VILGIFARTFQRRELEEVLDAVQAHGLQAVQFNMASAGLASMPDSIEPGLAARVRAALAARGLQMAAVSGTYNMIHPDPRRREDGLRRLAVLGAACRAMGTSTITLCTGTRHPDDKWRWHPENVLPDAWHDLRAAMACALTMAEEQDVYLAIEPERANVVSSAESARRLLDEMRSPRLKVVLDPVNLQAGGEAVPAPAVVEEAVDLLGPDLVAAHAKELFPGGAGWRLDYEHYVGRLRAAGFRGPLLLHNLREDAVGQAVHLLRGL
jgi:sugar phosphate isomerase/epimerase